VVVFTVATVCAIVCGGVADVVHKQRVAQKKAFTMERLRLHRDQSRLKSQLLMANSKSGQLVRSERLRLTRSGSVAASAALLELTQDNVQDLANCTSEMVRQQDVCCACDAVCNAMI